ncbi:unnamed protein product [Clavelina lepadiformis]|uniref:Uncharacterized protein n=1 Tax=Clavelina lepadiformis TaxID=159417 RepID=A0ABP0FKL4_CLALP
MSQSVLYCIVFAFLLAWQGGVWSKPLESAQLSHSVEEKIDNSHPSDNLDVIGSNPNKEALETPPGDTDDSNTIQVDTAKVKDDNIGTVSEQDINNSQILAKDDKNPESGLDHNDNFFSNEQDVPLETDAKLKNENPMLSDTQMSDSVSPDDSNIPPNNAPENDMQESITSSMENDTPERNIVQVQPGIKKNEASKDQPTASQSGPNQNEASDESNNSNNQPGSTVLENSVQPESDLNDHFDTPPGSDAPTKVDDNDKKGEPTATKDEIDISPENNNPNETDDPNAPTEVDDNDKKGGPTATKEEIDISPKNNIPNEIDDPNAPTEPDGNDKKDEPTATKEEIDGSPENYVPNEMDDPNASTGVDDDVKDKDKTDLKSNSNDDDIKSFQDPNNYTDDILFPSNESNNNVDMVIPTSAEFETKKSKEKNSDNVKDDSNPAPTDSTNSESPDSQELEDNSNNLDDLTHNNVNETLNQALPGSDVESSSPSNDLQNTKLQEKDQGTVVQMTPSSSPSSNDRETLTTSTLVPTDVEIDKMQPDGSTLEKKDESYSSTDKTEDNPPEQSEDNSKGVSTQKNAEDDGDTNKMVPEVDPGSDEVPETTNAGPRHRGRKPPGSADPKEIQEGKKETAEEENNEKQDAESETTSTTSTTTTTTILPKASSTKLPANPKPDESEGKDNVKSPTSTTITTSTLSTTAKSIVNQATNFAKNIVKKYGPAQVAAVAFVILLVIVLFSFVLCRCRKRSRHARLKEYGHEKEFLLTKKGSGKYQSDRLTLLDESSEDEL